MRFYTKEYLKNLSKSQGLAGTRTFSYYASESRNLNYYDIFLSHSYKDKEYIEGLFMELTSKGYSVYVDWIVDPELSRGNVTKATVNLLRSRMKNSKSLVYATSESASYSKWMPWELGFMDGDKGKCAILPITNHEKNVFRGQEFLSVYPIIGRDDIGYSGELQVEGLGGISNMKKMNSWINF